MKVLIYAFLTSAVDGGQWSASRPGTFIPREITPRICVNYKVILSSLKCRNSTFILFTPAKVLKHIFATLSHKIRGFICLFIYLYSPFFADLNSENLWRHYKRERIRDDRTFHLKKKLINSPNIVHRRLTLNLLVRISQNNVISI
jgi:hypothetical protein